MYNTDGYIISNLVQENYIDYSNSIENIALSSDSISYGDTILSRLYECNNFNHDMHCIYSTYLPSCYSRSYVKNNNKGSNRSSVINNRYNIYLNNKAIINKINLNDTRTFDIYEIYIIKLFLNQSLVKLTKLTNHQLNFIKALLSKFSESIENQQDNINKLELIYKHFSDFNIENNKDKYKKFSMKFKKLIT